MQNENTCDIWRSSCTDCKHQSVNIIEDLMHIWFTKPNWNRYWFTHTVINCSNHNTYTAHANQRHVLLLDYTLSLVFSQFLLVMLPQVCPVIMPLCCLYTNMHLLLEEFTISLRSSLSTQSVCHNKSRSQSWSLILSPESELESRFFRGEVGVRSPKFSNPGIGVGFPQKIIRLRISDANGYLHLWTYRGSGNLSACPTQVCQKALSFAVELFSSFYQTLALSSHRGHPSMHNRSSVVGEEAWFYTQDISPLLP